MERLFRRAQLPVTMSQGFHPKQKVSYVSALALGLAGEDEVMELSLDVEEGREPMASPELLRRLSEVSVPGLEFVSAEPLEETVKKSAAAAFLYEVSIPERLTDGLERKIEELLAAEQIPLVKSKGRQIDLRPAILSLGLRREPEKDAILEFRLAAADGPSAGPRELLDALGLADELFRTLFPVRTRTFLRGEDFSPSSAFAAIPDKPFGKEKIE